LTWTTKVWIKQQWLIKYLHTVGILKPDIQILETFEYQTMTLGKWIVQTFVNRKICPTVFYRLISSLEF
jgi:hypothetical protein